MKNLFQKTLCLLILSLCFNNMNFAQYYNYCAGQNVIYEDHKLFSSNKKIRQQAEKNTEAEIAIPQDEESILRMANQSYRIEKVKQKDGSFKEVKVERKKVAVDKYGNAESNQFDLAVDGAFIGNTIAVLHFYTGENFNFEKPKAALAEKGFGVYRWLNYPPSPEELRSKLQEANQLWIISNSDQRLNEEHLEVIKDFFNQGKGVYIWGDNAPYYADANYVGQALMNITMSGNLSGGRSVMLKDEQNQSGIRQNHLITTGMNYLFEGITIATISENEHMTPLVWGSAGNLVTAVYEKDGKRAIFDGGFTRLYCNWDTAGTGRYVKNAAAWLANVENDKEVN